MGVKLYYQPGCFACGTIAQLLSTRGIAFEHHDALNDAEAAAFLHAHNILSVPVTVINDEIIVGLDEPRLQKALSKLTATTEVDASVG
jgi:glutaredoxin